MVLEGDSSAVVEGYSRLRQSEHDIALGTLRALRKISGGTAIGNTIEQQVNRRAANSQIHALILRFGAKVGTSPLNGKPYLTSKGIGVVQYTYSEEPDVCMTMTVLDSWVDLDYVSRSKSASDILSDFSDKSLREKLEFAKEHAAAINDSRFEYRKGKNYRRAVREKGDIKSYSDERVYIRPVAWEGLSPEDQTSLEQAGFL